MSRPAVKLLCAALLVIAGLLCRSVSDIASALADRHADMARLFDAEAEPPSAWRGMIERLLDPSAPAHAALAAYWSGAYDRLAGDGSPPADDPAALLVAANAVFRRAAREAGGTPDAGRLDAALQAYAGVLKNGGFHRDAAFNYELVARLRDEAARARSRTPRPRPTAPAAPADDDLPAGITIHGRPGAHPPPTKGEDFEVLTPMDYGEREAQPEPTPGRRLPRKG